MRKCIMKKYKDVCNLNSKKSPSTGTSIAFYGKSPWKVLKGPYMFFEVSDCSNKIRLHNSQIDTPADFLRKMKKLQKQVNDFVDFLEKV